MAGLQASQAAQSQFARLGAEAAESEAQHMAAKLVQFKSSLEAFALKHRGEIGSDPAFRAQFQAMCAAVGVDPLASNKGFWVELLGFGDFYYELAVQIGAPAARRDSTALRAPTLTLLLLQSRSVCAPAPRTGA